MNGKFIVLYVLMIAMMASSCNRDEVITDDDPAGGNTTTGSYRPKNINSQATCNCVFEYTPANHSSTYGQNKTQITTSTSKATKKLVINLKNFFDKKKALNLPQKETAFILMPLIPNRYMH